MPGKLCFGSDYNNAGPARIRSSVSYCEGIHYRSGGTALEKPITDNPHVSGSDAADAWDAGWTAANGAAGTSLKIGCCAITTVIPV